MPPETMEDEGEVELLAARRGARPPAPAADLDRAAELLLAARGPLIYAGGGVHLSGAHEALAPGGRAPAGRRRPVRGGQGRGERPQHALARRRALARVRAARARRTRRTWCWRWAAAWPRSPSSRAPASSRSTRTSRRSGATTRTRSAWWATRAPPSRPCWSACAPRPPPRPSRKAEHEALRAEVAGREHQEPKASIIRSLRAGAPENTILVAGMTQIGYYSRPFWPVYEPRTYLSSSYSGNLGFAYPAALGAKVARPDRPVVSLSGDGGFLYNAQELATAARTGSTWSRRLQRQAYGNVARDLDEAWGGQYGADCRTPTS